MSVYIDVKNISKTIGGNKILDGINLSLHKGKVYGFNGHNGSGKTMLFRSICGLLVPTTGEVIIEGKRIGKDISFPDSVGALIEYPGFLPQYSGFKNLRILASIKKQINEEQVYAAMQKVGLSPNDTRKYKKYSLGMKQRLGIAQAIMENPNLLIFDEPTNALDREGIEIVKNIINELKQKSKTIIMDPRI